MQLRILILLALLFVFGNTRAQYSAVRTGDTTGISTRDPDNYSYMRFGMRYKSDHYYVGRADSAKAPYIIPSIGYYHKSGFFASTALSYLVTSEDNRIDLYTISGGYDYYGERFAAGISLDQYFFDDESYSVQAEMRTFLSAFVGFDLKGFLLLADASLGFSNSTDGFLGIDISRTFYTLKNKLLITPAFYINWGTQQYYNEYYQNRSITTGGGMGGRGSGKGPGGNGGSTTVIQDIRIEESEKFQILDYEASLQVSYKINELRIMAAGTLLFPVNPSTVTIENTTYQEDLENGFLWSVGARYILKFKK